jgi:hypothetical protein
MKLEFPEIRPDERTPLVETLLAMIRQVLDRVQQLEHDNQHLRDELARLKGQKPKPHIQPSRLEQPEQAQGGTTVARRRGQPSRPKTAELTMHRTVEVHPAQLPAGATLPGYESFVVQELQSETGNTTYQRAR